MEPVTSPKDNTINNHLLHNNINNKNVINNRDKVRFIAILFI
jgi:hypothetical protein